MSVLAIVLPVFLVIVLGVVLTRTRFIGAELIGELNRLTYFVGLPAYLFSSISEATGTFYLASAVALPLVYIGYRF